MIFTKKNTIFDLKLYFLSSTSYLQNQNKNIFFFYYSKNKIKKKMTQQINYQTHIPESIPIIFEWMIKQDQLIKETEDFKELDKVLKEIDNDKDYSKDSFLDIQFLLRPFEEQLPLKIKRLFNISLLDN